MSGQIKIEKGVPLPQPKPAKRVANPRGGYKYPWLEMKIGDSFMMRGSKIIRNRVRAGSTRAERLYGLKFVTRTIGGAIRVWRVK